MRADSKKSKISSVELDAVKAMTSVELDAVKVKNDLEADAMKVKANSAREMAEVEEQRRANELWYLERKQQLLSSSQPVLSAEELEAKDNKGPVHTVRSIWKTTAMSKVHLNNLYEFLGRAGQLAAQQITVRAKIREESGALVNAYCDKDVEKIKTILQQAFHGNGVVTRGDGNIIHTKQQGINGFLLVGQD